MFSSYLELCRDFPAKRRCFKRYACNTSWNPLVAPFKAWRPKAFSFSGSLNMIPVLVHSGPGTIFGPPQHTLFRAWHLKYKLIHSQVPSSGFKEEDNWNWNVWISELQLRRSQSEFQIQLDLCYNPM